ncbi:MAG: helix-turn-helix domain-containing protein [Clostridiales bacterium]|nr:helix-turn-helix domain-containing protein [Clostridiales bacterium]
MFSTKKFGGFLSRLRKNADMTQSELADKLNLTRQAVSRYETGDSFPDVSVLVKIGDIFGITLDELINSGEPSRGQSEILENIAKGKEANLTENSADVSDIVGLAPFLKPSVLEKLAEGLSKQGIDISNIVSLAEYLNDKSISAMLEKADFENISEELLEKLAPLLDNKSKYTVFEKILEGKTDWHLIKVLIPYMDYIQSQIEAAVVEGALPWDTLNELREGNRRLWEKMHEEGNI